MQTKIFGLIKYTRRQTQTHTHTVKRKRKLFYNPLTSLKIHVLLEHCCFNTLQH